MAAGSGVRVDWGKDVLEAISMSDIWVGVEEGNGVFCCVAALSADTWFAQPDRVRMRITGQRLRYLSIAWNLLPIASLVKSTMADRDSPMVF